MKGTYDQSLSKNELLTILNTLGYYLDEFCFGKTHAKYYLYTSSYYRNSPEEYKLLFASFLKFEDFVKWMMIIAS